MSRKRIDVDEVKKSKYLQQTLDFLKENYKIAFKMAGNESELRKCPLHDDKKTRSFNVRVVDDEIKFHCFGACNSDFDIVNIIMRLDRIKFKPALELFAEYLKRTRKDKVEAPPFQEPPEDNIVQDSKQPTATADPDFEEELEFAANLYHDVLMAEGKEQDHFRKYLAKRGVGDNEIHRFGIGVSPSYKSDYNGRALCDAKGNKWRMKDDGRLMVGIAGTSILSCLRSKQVYFQIGDKFACKIVFPVRGLDGKIKAMMGRNTKKGGTWRTHRGAKKGSLLYGLDKNVRNIIRNKTVILVEGIYDFFALHKLFRDQDLQSIVVATMGPVTKVQVAILESLPKLLGVKLLRRDATEDDQARLLKSLDVENYVVAFDNDDAGESFLNRLTGLVGPNKNVFRMDLRGLKDPNDKDPNDVYAKVLPFLDLNQMLEHMRIAKETKVARERVFTIRIPGGLKGRGRGLGGALKMWLFKKGDAPAEASLGGASGKPKNPKIMYFDGDNLKELLSYDNDRMPKSRIKDIESLFKDYAAEPFECSVRLHAAFVKWGYKKTGNALILLLWLVMEQQQRSPHEIADNATKMAVALNTNRVTIQKHLAVLRRNGFLIVDEDVKTRERFTTAYLNPESLNKEKKRVKKGRRRIYPPVFG